MYNALSERTGVSKKIVEEVLSAFTNYIKEDVRDNGKQLRLLSFGTFKQKISPLRTGRNPQTGESLQIPASTGIAFVASPKIRVKDA